MDRSLMAANVGWVLVVSFLLLLVLFNLRIVGACDFMICEIWLFFFFLIWFDFLIYKSYSPDFFYKLLTKLINSRFYNFRPVSIPLCGTSWAYSLCPGPSQLGLFNLQRQTSSNWSVCYVAHSQMRIQIVSSLKLSSAAKRPSKEISWTNKLQENWNDN